MSVLPFHALTRDPPHGTLWIRGGQKVYGDVPRAHSELVVLLGLSGRAKYLIDGQMLALGRGGMIWALAGQRHMLVSDSGGFDMAVAVVHPAIWARRPLVPVSVPDAPEVPPLRQLAEPAVSELEALARGVAQTSELESLRSGLIWFLNRAHVLWRQGAEGGGAALHPSVAKAALILREDPSADLDNVCAQSGLTRSRLGKLFVQQMGETPGQFRTRQRLLAADTLVARGDSLLSAALGAGFGSYAQFFRDFRKLRGSAPRDWYRI